MTFSPTIIHLPAVDSTQDEAWRLVQAGTGGHGLVIRADHQIKGRGRQGRVWETDRDVNLAATLVYHLTGPNVRASDYALITAVSLHAAAAEFLRAPGDLQIKWPNDLMLAGKKCAGILIESPKSEWLLIGTGVNIATAPDGRARLADDAAGTVTAETLLDRYLNHFARFDDEYRQSGLAPVARTWTAHAYGVGRSMSVRTPREEFQGVFEGLDETGAARVRCPDGSLRVLHAGEVFF